MKKTEQEMNRAEPMSRRRSLKALGVVAASTGGVWSKPVVESVVLPAHANTTPPSTIMCPDVTVELVAPPTNSGTVGALTACRFSLVALSTDPMIPVTITGISSDQDGMNLGVVSTDPLPGEATNADGVGFIVIAGGFIDQMTPNTCVLVANPDVNLTIEFECENGEGPRSQSFALSTLVPTLDEDEDA